MEANSKEYRAERFDTEWLPSEGKYKSAFFSSLGYSCFPLWLTGEIESRQLSICDWGCTLGVCTNLLQSRFPHSRITGIDFSAAAIASAREVYPQIQFQQEGAWKAATTVRYDVLFSSNTLEYFSNPWEVLERLSDGVDRHLVILVPYKEIELQKGHLYSFTEGNIPGRIGASFSLTHMEIIDVSRFTPTYWGELQALLVYSHHSAVAEGRLRTISGSEVRIIEGLREQKELLKQLEEVKASLEKRQDITEGSPEDKSTLFKEVLSAQEEAIRSLRLALQEKDAAAEKLLAERAELTGRLEQQDAQHEATLKAVNGEKEQLAAELAKVLERTKVHTGIHTLMQEQLAEKEAFIKQLQNSLEEEGSAIKGLQRTNLDLQQQAEKLQAELQWYRATYEYRSLLGVVKEKIRKSLRGR
jgi:hypothetical protein